MRSLPALLACSLLAACAGKAEKVCTTAEPVHANWRAVATDPDRDRLRRWRDAWIEALDKARGAGKGAEITAGGALFEPDLALTGAMPPAGDYRCRTFKLGAKEGSAAAEFTAYPWSRCRIEADGDVLGFRKDDGPQRPIGRIYRESNARAIFLGTLTFGDEMVPVQYGRDDARDMAGVVERVGERRWRIALPYPAYESLLDVIELAPAA
ncbi:DUF4893 domain-containing protein [Sphingomonas cannabina]|uniref:DUF4893 domain-containing protein n=1 Tax=Sphingomonas cannabina TaxID=2899123 RepID=UPI001F36D83B|nr:DUF4893 domain-containing protein [Sphingomonas cannabina]UIJ46791.1 DUF4893 domain-containing protein [Sphingomonas cannabina]